MQQSFEKAVEILVERYSQYPVEAYEFMRAGLDAAADKFRKDDKNPHLSAEELYLGACSYALEEYGPLALAVMEQWNITTSTDVGNLVYNLIEVGVFGKQDGDRQEQFDNLTPVSLLLDAPYETLTLPN